MYSNKYFEWYWENPLKTYNKVKEYFLPIKPKFQWWFRKGTAARIFELNAFDVSWKRKYDMVRHEYNPRISISLFNYIHIYCTWTLGTGSMQDLVYWETALTWLYDKVSLPDAFDDCGGWTEPDEETGEYRPIKFTILKEPWQTMYNNNELPKIKYESTT